MDDHKHHETLMDSFAKEYKDLLINSKQAVYVYLDDVHKLCNKRFSDLLGYDSPDEWQEVKVNFPEAFVAPDYQETLVGAYQNTMEDLTASQNVITWKRKDGQFVKSEVILVPIVFKEHLFALHFVS